MVLSFPFEFLFLPFLAALVLAVLGMVIHIHLRQPAIGALLFLLAAFPALVIGPGMLLDRVILGEDRVIQATGLWFSQSKTSFRYDDIRSISITTESDRKNRSYRLWTIHLANGNTEKFDPSDLWSRNEAIIVEFLTEKGVAIKRQR